MVPTCWSEAEGEGRDGASWERINSKNKKQCLTAAESRRRAQPSSLGSPQQPPPTPRIRVRLDACSLDPWLQDKQTWFLPEESGAHHQLLPRRPLRQVSPRAQPFRCFLDCCRLWAPGWEPYWLSKLAVLGGSSLWCGSSTLGVLGVRLKPLAPQGLAFPPTRVTVLRVGLWQG